MNPAVILALVAELYEKVAVLTDELKSVSLPSLETPDGYKAYQCPDGKYTASWGGQWLSVYGDSPEEAVTLGRVEVSKG